MNVYLTAALNYAKGLVSGVGMLWCKAHHDAAMWPVRGRYQCRRCLRYHRGSVGIAGSQRPLVISTRTPLVRHLIDPLVPRKA